MIAQLHQLLCRETALWTLRAAAVYDDSRVLGQIRAAYFIAYLVQRHAARAGNYLTFEPLIG